MDAVELALSTYVAVRDGECYCNLSSAAQSRAAGDLAHALLREPSTGCCGGFARSEDCECAAQVGLNA